MSRTVRPQTSTSCCIRRCGRHAGPLTTRGAGGACHGRIASRVNARRFLPQFFELVGAAQAAETAAQMDKEAAAAAATAAAATSIATSTAGVKRKRGEMSAELAASAAVVAAAAAATDDDGDIVFMEDGTAAVEVVAESVAKRARVDGAATSHPVTAADSSSVIELDD